MNGSAIPNVTFDAGESYAGNLSITDDPSNPNQLWFWFWPSTNVNASDEIVIWLNGGPGCSSLDGFFQENGPFLWQRYVAGERIRNQLLTMIVERMSPSKTLSPGQT